ncbi:hypothetical protein OIU77_022483 [Salix suchowensis]|uniref:Uncharacterized protein n=1 Tax=Salix suchowensis TaxID=1278906 RepID=A0ABQ9C2G6_9ROSI|nr:hypothetical protein OIU77_022483 [Salix suchowensis]
MIFIRTFRMRAEMFAASQVSDVTNIVTVWYNSICPAVDSLPPIISNLSGLRYLILDENHFHGIIPPEFSSLRHLHSLRLDSNNLQGSFPPGFPSALPNLTVLTLRENLSQKSE